MLIHTCSDGCGSGFRGHYGGHEAGCGGHCGGLEVDLRQVTDMVHDLVLASLRPTRVPEEALFLQGASNCIIQNSNVHLSLTFALTMHTMASIKC